MNWVQRAVGRVVGFGRGVGLGIGMGFRALMGDERATLKDASGWLFSLLTGGGSVTPATASRIGTVFSCVQILSETIASLPCVLYKRVDDDRRERSKLPMARLLRWQANPRMTAFTFWRVMVTNLLLHGNAYAEIQVDAYGIPVALWPIPSKYVNPLVRKDGSIVYDIASLSVALPAARVLHLKGYSLDGLVGLSPIAVAAHAFATANAAEVYGRNFFENGGLPRGVLEHPGKLSEGASTRLKSNFDTKYGSLENSQRVALLEEGMKFTAITISPKDAQFLEVRAYSKGEIASIFRVPLHMLNDKGPVGWGNLEQATMEFLQYTIRPYLVNIEQEIHWKLLRGDEQYYAEHLVESLLRADTKGRYDAYATARQNGWMSANDIRRLENMDPIENGDLYLVAANMISAEQAGKQSASDAGSAPNPAPAKKSLGPIIQDVADRIVRREVADIERLRAKHKDPVECRAAVWQYLQSDHREWTARAILPLLEAYGSADGRVHIAERWITHCWGCVGGVGDVRHLVQLIEGEVENA